LLAYYNCRMKNLPNVYLNFLFFLSTLFILLFVSTIVMGDSEKTTNLRVSGSTTVLPLAQSATEEFLKSYPNINISVSGAGTGEGLRALIYGNLDIANASRDLKAVEIERAKEGGVILTKHLVALDCLAVIIHPTNPVKNLTLNQLRGIYDGHYKNWQELGGEDRTIVAINRDGSSGTFELWLEKILLGKRFRKDAQVQASSGGVAHAVSGNKNAIGYVGLGFVSSSVKAVPVMGILPSPEKALDGTYPISRELYMFTRQDSAPESLLFIDFVKSEEAKPLLEKEGFVPLPSGDGEK